MKRFNEGQIKAEHLGCPYCMSIVSIEQLGCCGESSGHFVTMYEIDGQEDCYFTEEDVFIEPEPSVLELIEERQR